MRCILLLLTLVASSAFGQTDLPDPKLTPGRTDPRVTQANIDVTICVPGYSQTVRPPVSYTNKLKRMQIDQYGFVDKDSHNYEEDHLISIELGGAPRDPKNLWPQHWDGCGAHMKDILENKLHHMICTSQVPLAEAQKAIAKDWKAAYLHYIGRKPCK
jgi:hypothetical protein